MKKYLFVLFMACSSFSLFAQTKPNVFFFLEPITGISINLRDNERFARMLINEIRARRCSLIETPHEADFILSGTVGYYYEDDYGDVDIKDKYGPPETVYSYNSATSNFGENVYLFQLTLRNVKTYKMILQQNLYYTSLDDVDNFFPLLVYNLFSYISDAYAFNFNLAMQNQSQKPEDWKNKWLYLRVSFDFPITYYKLKGDGLIDGTLVYDGDIDNPTAFSPVDNKIVGLPAATAGLELQFLDWCSIEPKFLVGWEKLNNANFANLAAGVDIRFPVKLIRNVILEPYVSVLFPIPTSASKKVFDSFPVAAAGGGFQLGLKGGKSGVVFIDANYMYSIGDAVMENPYGSLYPNPSVIHHQRSVIGLGIGYKFGFIGRK
ncbi:MAG: hypothetical protein LBG95_03885 [Treponema sp.]|jgi:hypothetical protein|nr:hypothetical protein [Treponema sp.]